MTQYRYFKCITVSIISGVEGQTLEDQSVSEEEGRASAREMSKLQYRQSGMSKGIFYRDSGGKYNHLHDTISHLGIFLPVSLHCVFSQQYGREIQKKEKKEKRDRYRAGLTCHPALEPQYSLTECRTRKQ